MTRERASLSPLVRLDRGRRAALHRQLYEQLRQAVLSGRARPGTLLPSTRGLARELGVARNTVKLAFEQLMAEGYLESRVGSGTRVSGGFRPPPAATAPGRAGSRGANRSGARSRPALPAAPRVPASLPGEPPAHVRAFQVGVPALDLFPIDVWARLAGRHWRGASFARLAYGDARGDRRLREAIAAHVGATRGVRCDPDRILVVSGSQGGLDLIARVLVARGAAVWVEDPGYFGAHGAAAAAGARLVPVPVDGEGLDVAAGRRAAPRARLAFVTPSHHMPLGVTMSLARRLELLDWARRARAWIVEDDYDSEYRYDARPLMALQGLDRDDRVIYVGTFSKTLFPSLRLGFVVLPADLVDRFVAARSLVDRQGPTVDQAVLADFVSGGHYARHLRRMRSAYKERQDTLVRLARGRLGDRLRLSPGEAGMHLVAWLPAGTDERAAAETAARAGVALLPLGTFRLRRSGSPGLVFGYGATPPGTIRDALEALDRAWRDGFAPARRRAMR